jgi:signal transduction histidine kinase
LTLRGEEAAISRRHPADATVAARPSSEASVRLGDFLSRLGARRSDVRACAALARACPKSHDPRRESASKAAIALLNAVADVLARRALDHAWRRSDVAKAVNAVAEIACLPDAFVRSDIHARVARDPRIIHLSPGVAIEIEIKLLFALTEVDHVSLWTKGPLEAVRSRFHAGRGKQNGRSRFVARAVLEGARAERSGSTHGIPVLRWQRPDGVLVFETTDDQAAAAARSTCAALALILEREALLMRNTARERALVEPRERLLTRLGFDLHDGAIQDVAALAGEIRLLRTQVEGVLPPTVGPAGLIGRFDDLEARVVAVDHALRQMVHSLESPGATRRPLDQVLRREVGAFAEQTDLEVDLTLRGEFSELSDSQRIALTRIIQESLTNVREHSAATKVSISVTSARNEIVAEITDNGRGFDVGQTLVRAARNGRVGLLGMSERARLLGGRFDVRSRRGGPTRVSVTLPAWRPAAVAVTSTVTAEAQSVG